MKKCFALLSILLLVISIGFMGRLPLWTAKMGGRLTSYDHKLCEKEVDDVGEKIIAALSARAFTLQTDQSEEEILAVLHAEVCFSQQLSDRKVVYAHSPLLFGYHMLRGKKVNLQLSITENGAIIGNLLLIGSF